MRKYNKLYNLLIDIEDMSWHSDKILNMDEELLLEFEDAVNLKEKIQEIDKLYQSLNNRYHNRKQVRQ